METIGTDIGRAAAGGATGAAIAVGRREPVVSLDLYDRPVYDPPGDWRTSAACRGVDPNLFHPERGEPASACNAAKAVCNTCPSAQPCLIYALSNLEKYGVWGGLDTKERREAVKVLGRMRVCPECTTVFYVPWRPGFMSIYCSDDCRRIIHARNQAESHRRKRLDRTEVA